MSAYPLESVGAASTGFHPPALAVLEQVIEGHIAQGRYPGAQLALARHGKLAMVKSFGRAALAPERATCDDTLFLVFSNTKVITAAGIWALVEDGVLPFTDRIARHIPEFAKHGKGDITISQLLSHRAGFPTQDMPIAAWTDHSLMREVVCDFTLEWTPGSRREFLRKRITEPLGIADDLFIVVIRRIPRDHREAQRRYGQYFDIGMQLPLCAGLTRRIFFMRGRSFLGGAY